MSPALMGVEMDGNVRAWGNDQRRVGSILALVGAAIFLVAALVVYFVAGDGGETAYWTLLVLVALCLVFQVLLLVLKPATSAPAAPAMAAASEPAPAAEPSWQPAPPAPAAAPVRTLTLRCSDCGTVFDLADTGERPLHHTCPGCGAEGVLRDDMMPVSAPPVPQPQENPYAPPGEVAASAPPAAPPVKRLKLRCGGCKEVFTIDDSGERPLRRPCPYCGRMGEVK